MPRSAEYRPGHLSKRLAELEALDRAQRALRRQPPKPDPADEWTFHRPKATLADWGLVALTLVLGWAILYGLLALWIGE